MGLLSSNTGTQYLSVGYCVTWACSPATLVLSIKCGILCNVGLLSSNTGTQYLSVGYCVTWACSPATLVLNIQLSRLKSMQIMIFVQGHNTLTWLGIEPSSFCTRVQRLASMPHNHMLHTTIISITSWFLITILL